MSGASRSGVMARAWRGTVQQLDSLEASKHAGAVHFLLFHVELLLRMHNHCIHSVSIFLIIIYTPLSLSFPFPLLLSFPLNPPLTTSSQLPIKSLKSILEFLQIHLLIRLL
jgi:hypothetical protein